MENTRYPCPVCRAPADLVSGCSGCRRPPDAEAAEVIRLDAEIVALGAELERARLAYAEVADRFQRARQRRAMLAARVRSRVGPVAPVPVRRPPTPPGRPGRPETSTRTVQGLLFVLGGLLLGTAAVVFTAVAWAAVGVAGRALILAAVTALALAVPLVAVRRGLRGTAETVAAVGLLLVLLDGYAAWSVDLGGVTGWPGTRYAALVGGAVTAVAAAYGRLSGLTGPWFAALVAAQPVLPLLVAEARPPAAGWSAVLVGVALLDLAVLLVLTRRFAGVPSAPGAAVPSGPAPAGAADVTSGPAPARDTSEAVSATAPAGSVSPAAGPTPGDAAGATSTVRPAVTAARVLAWTAFGVALLAAAGYALEPLALGRVAGTPLLAGLPLLLVTLTLAGAAVLTGDRTFRQVANGLLVPVLAVALLRPVGELRPSLLLLATALVVTALAGVVMLLPHGWRTGPRIAALAVTSSVAVSGGVLTGLLALATAGRSLPPWRGAAPGPDLDWGWQLPVAVALSVAAVGVLAPRAARPVAAPVGLALAVLALPAAWPASWPAVLAADLAGAVVLVAVLLRPVARSAAPPSREPAAASAGSSGGTPGGLPATVPPSGGVSGGLRVMAPPSGGVSGAVPVTALAVAALLGHAVLVGMARPAGALAALGAVLVLGAALALLGGRASVVPRPVAGCALVAALLTLPVGATVALIAGGASPGWQARAALAAVGPLLGALHLTRRHRPELGGYAAVALAAAAAGTGLAPVLPSVGEPLALYAALAVLPLAVGLPVSAGRGRGPGVVAAARRREGGPVLPSGGAVALPVTGAVLLTVAVAAAAPEVLRALLVPYGRAVPAWSGAPAAEPAPAALPAGVALALLAIAVAVAGRTARFPRAAILLAALPFAGAVPSVLLLAAGAPWPVGPSVTLLGGVAALLAAALVSPRPLLLPVTVPVGLALATAGMAGLTATRAGTLAGLGVLLVAAVVAAATGRRGETRVVGCLAAVGAATGLAVTAPLAAGLPLADAAFAVLVVAALTLAVAALIARPAPGTEVPTARGPLLRSVLDAAAQAVALVAFLLTADALRPAAAVCVLWGAAVGLRLLRGGEPAGRRWAFAAVAGGSELLGAWLLLASGRVVLLEAYTLPAAALALGAGLVALRTRPGLTSWLALGPGLGAALLPSLVSILVAADPQPWRRLLLGAGALVAVLAGAVRRWQAPVLLGGVSLALLALHELARSWDLLPRWIFLAVGGLALITLAATYERRRRDLHRLRAVVSRMS
ncbi:SCO7613 C-terminal domain-containing membrane protein [Micromonospora globbae]|uniref:SCO7613 C-terminal domain-containing membrane protein n=1 Tax=Micromonospora globbae TaxID=1894969 RepID=UPI003792517F